MSVANLGVRVRGSQFVARAAATAAALSAAGCANLQSIYQESRLDEDRRGHWFAIDKRPTSVSVDVKQRLVLSKLRKDRDKNSEQVVICAEPSPDALTVIASGLSGSANLGAQKAFELSGALTETGSFVGTRTVTIQLLRDNLYRACEAYMSGALSAEQYYVLQRRYQVMTMGLLAIEQLTSTVRTNPVVISAGGTSAIASADRANEKRDRVAKESAQLTQAQDQMDAAQSNMKLAEAGDDAEKKANARKEFEAAKLKYDEFTKRVALAQAEYDEVRAGSGTKVVLVGGAASSAATAGAAQDSAAPAVSSVAEKVESIVRNIVFEGFQREDCTHAYSRGKSDPRCGSVILNQTEEVLGAIDICPEGQERSSCAEKALTKAGTTKAKFFINVREELGDPASSEKFLRADAVAISRAIGELSPELPDVRVDVFATDKRRTDQETLAKAIETAKTFNGVRKRSVSQEDCAGRFNVKGSVVIRYDEDSRTEQSGATKLKTIVEGALGVKDATLSSVTTPTPLYMSIFLCNKN